MSSQVSKKSQKKKKKKAAAQAQSDITAATESTTPATTPETESVEVVWFPTSPHDHPNDPCRGAIDLLPPDIFYLTIAAPIVTEQDSNAVTQQETMPPLIRHTSNIHLAVSAIVPSAHKKENSFVELLFLEQLARN